MVHFEEHVYATKPVVACGGEMEFYDCSSFVYQTDLNYVYQFERFFKEINGKIVRTKPHLVGINDL